MANHVHGQPRYTRRLMLRPFRRRDVGTLHEAITASVHELQPWLPWIDGYDKGFAQRFIRESVGSWSEQRAYDFTIRPLHDLERHIGNVSIWPTSHQNRTGEVGYWIRSEETGHGYGTEAAAVAIGIGFNELELHKVVLRIAVGNVASEKMAQKLGFTFEGILRDEVKVGSQWLDHTSWSILDTEWAARPTDLWIDDAHA
ncbi:MAG: GNAT family N-acetyltransferase [Acidimicrobiia bacterium]|nr:GNAT family N-acetyltransferase [Acidimicrobiia bacterium]